jgi:hypothetical protein
VLQAISSTGAAAPAPSEPSRIEAVGIVISARNQSSAIAACIHGIFAASSHAGWRKSLWIVVVADACTDATAKAARDALGAFGEVLEIAARCHPTADRIGVSAVMEHFHRMPRHALLLASIDAGTKLRADWFDVKRPTAGATKATPRAIPPSKGTKPWICTDLVHVRGVRRGHFLFSVSSKDQGHHDGGRFAEELSRLPT